LGLLKPRRKKKNLEGYIYIDDEPTEKQFLETINEIKSICANRDCCNSGRVYWNAILAQAGLIIECL
jgi:hypothetical protein